MVMARERNASIFRDANIVLMMWGMRREFRRENLLENLYLEDRKVFEI